MSIDSSLKTGGSLAKHRNVLSRTERVAQLSTRGKFDPDKGNPIGLPKVGNRKVHTGKSAKKKDEAAADGTAPAAK
ncbi:MAG: small basic protein [Phycisphaeraceae bacterium]|nr:small basic protein [Phycisphaeraceae bacterium]